MKKLILTLVYTSVLALQCFADDITVKLTITAAEPLQSELSSHLRREFRDLRDVVITQGHGADYNISVVALTADNHQDGSQMGYAVSVLLTAPLPTNCLDNVVFPRYQAGVEHLLSTAELVGLHQVFLCPPDGVALFSEKLVTRIDTQFFERTRQDRLAVHAETNSVSKIQSTNNPYLSAPSP